MVVVVAPVGDEGLSELADGERVFSHFLILPLYLLYYITTVCLRVDRMHLSIYSIIIEDIHSSSINTYLPHPVAHSETIDL